MILGVHPEKLQTHSTHRGAVAKGEPSPQLPKSRPQDHLSLVFDVEVVV